jgi:hypothetical protein
VWRSSWRERSLVWLQFAGFVVVTAVFWAHTSHRAYLDIYLMVFAAPVILAAGRQVRRLWLSPRTASAPR